MRSQSPPLLSEEVLMNLSVAFHFARARLQTMVRLEVRIGTTLTNKESDVNIRRRLLSAVLALAPARDRPWHASGVTTRNSPVFLHGGWRCGSTYVWNRFRQSPHTLCYYEPFHEVLRRCTPKKIHRDTSSNWNSRHPPLDRPYRDEYLPLLGLRRGVRRYHDDFAVARYFPSKDALAPEVRYLSRLLHHGARAGKCAVFGFSRSLARAGAIKAALGGFHIVIHRDPVQQWLSCRSYRIAEGSTYFELCHFMILALACPNSPAGHFAQTLGLPRPPPGTFRQQFDFLKCALSPWSNEVSYRSFLAVTLLSYSMARKHADLTIDLDRLSLSSEYRDALRRTIFSRTGLTIGFDDCRLGKHDPAQAELDYDAVAHEVVRDLLSCGAPEQVGYSFRISQPVADRKQYVLA
jgi:hypothetical protein